MILERKQYPRRKDKGKKPKVIPEALYDLRADIGEKHDVSASHPDVVKRLRQQAERCREDLGDSSKKILGKDRHPAATL